MRYTSQEPAYNPSDVAFNHQQETPTIKGPAKTKEFDLHARNLEEAVFATEDLAVRLEVIMDRLRGAIPNDPSTDIDSPDCTMDVLRNGTSLISHNLDRISRRVAELEDYI